MAAFGDVPSILDAAQSGDERLLLVAMRDTLAAAIDGCTSMRDLAALTRRLMEVTKDLDALDAREEIEKTGLRLVDSEEPFDVTSL